MVISVNLVKLALLARGYNQNHILNPDIPEEREKIEEAFNKSLDDVLDVVKEGLLYRVQRLENVKANVSPILYGNKNNNAYGALGCSLDPEETIGKMFGKRSSLSLGYVGLWETIIALYGKKTFNNKEMIDKAKTIMKKLYDTTKKWTLETDYSFSVYSTPKVWGIVK